jgi:predicted nucleotide-binding protein
MRNQSKAKPKVFVGSSVESIKVAYAIQENLENDAEVTVWRQGLFELSKPAVDSLMRALDRSDFAIFVFAPNDALKLRQKKYTAVRDNVIFELGLFIGKLGRSRTFIVLPKDSQDLRIPTDLTGITPGTFDAKRKDKNLVAALGPFCNQVMRLLSRIGPVKKLWHPTNR